MQMLTEDVSADAVLRCPVCDTAELQARGSWRCCATCQTAQRAHPMRTRHRIRQALGEQHDALLASDALLDRIHELGGGDVWLRRPAGRPTLLQVNSGWGVTLAAADWRGFEVFGVEPDPVAAAHARSKHGVLVFESVGAVPVVPTDVIVLSEFSSHPDPASLLGTLVDRLVPDGLMVISLPLLDHPMHRDRDTLWSNPANALLYARDGVSRLMLRAGLFPETSWHHPTRPGGAVIVARRS